MVQLRNGGFEAEWSTEQSHSCLTLPEGGQPYFQDIGNIFVPPGWVFWFRHNPGTWDQPEGRDAWKQNDPNRVYSGDKAYMYFTFFRKHDAGLYQQVPVTPGTHLRLSAWAHAWSNSNVAGYADHGNPRCSVGVGCGGVAIAEGAEPPLNGDPLNDAIGNFTFWVGIDPTGGTDPLSSTVVWGQGWHIYNNYVQQLSVETTAQASTVTVFLRSRTLWAFENNDAYWDDAELTGLAVQEAPVVRVSQQPAAPKVGETVTLEARSASALRGVRLVLRQPSGAESVGTLVPGRDGDWYTWKTTTLPLATAGTYEAVFTAAGGVEETVAFSCALAVLVPRGLPRAQYPRTYVLLPPDADAGWAVAALEGSWDAHKYTIGNSTDDAGIGDLDSRRVIAVNPNNWPSDLKAFFDQYYPGVEVVVVEATTPAELTQRLKQL